MSPPVPTPELVRPLPGYRLELRYSDGTAGIVDLSHLAGKGVFSAWAEEPDLFQHVTLGPGHSIAWPGDLDLCGDALYLELTGRSPEDLFPRLRALGRGL